MKIRIGNICNYLAAFILFSFGVVYLFSPSFMDYHREALSMDWEDLDPSTRFLILALMRAVAGGFIASAVGIGALQFRFASSRLPWIPKIILVQGLLVSTASIYATLLIRMNTPGNPPTGLAIFGMVLLVTGFYFNQLAGKS